MPKRKRVNYGVQRKYKYSRHVTKIKSYPTSLEDGSVLDEDHSKTKNQDDLQEMGDSSEFCIQTIDSDHSNFTIDIKTEPASDYFEEHINAYETHLPNIITKVAENVERVSDCFKDHIQTPGLNSSEYVPEVYIKVEPASDYPEEEQYMECPKDTSKRDVEKIASVSVHCNDNIETVSTDNILKHTYIKVEPSSMDFQDRSVINDKKTLDNPNVPAVKVKALPLGVIENIVTNPINNPTERIIKVERRLIDSDDHTDTYNMNGQRIPTVCVFNLKPTVEYCNDHSQILGAGLSKNNAENYVKDTQQGYDNSNRRIVEINNELNYHIETNSVETPEMDLETVEEVKQEKENSECENFDHNAVSFSKLQTEVKANIREAFLVHADNRKLSLFQLYTKGGAASVELSIEVHSDFSCNLFVHRQSVPLTHSIWGGLPLLFDQCSSIMELCSRVQLHKVCPGNPDEEFVPFSPIGDGFNLNLAKPLRAFREGDFNVTYGKTGDKSYSRTIRTSNCQLLVSEADQCIKCKEYRSSLMTRKRHLAETADLNGSNVNTKFNGMMMSADMAKKLQEQKEKIHDLTREINKLRTKIKKHKQKQSDAKKLYV